MKLKIVLYLSLLLCISPVRSSDAEGNNKALPFETDGCTLFFDGDWKDCCIEHDFIYWIGGVKALQDQADLEVKNCVEDRGHEVLAEIMYFAIRTGHYSPIKHRYKWGWGLINGNQEVFIKSELQKLNINQTLKEKLSKKLTGQIK